MKTVELEKSAGLYAWIEMAPLGLRVPMLQIEKDADDRILKFATMVADLNLPCLDVLIGDNEIVMTHQSGETEVSLVSERGNETVVVTAHGRNESLLETVVQLFQGRDNLTNVDRQKTVEDIAFITGIPGATLTAHLESVDTLRLHYWKKSVEALKDVSTSVFNLMTGARRPMRVATLSEETVREVVNQIFEHCSPHIRTMSDDDKRQLGKTAVWMVVSKPKKYTFEQKGQLWRAFWAELGVAPPPEKVLV